MDHILGVYNAVVADTNDPTGAGRVRLYVPQVTGSAVSGWAHPAGTGTVQPGDKVYMSYAGGDRNYPQFWPLTPTVQSVQGQTGQVSLALQAGSHATVTGAGTPASPWVVTAQTPTQVACKAQGTSSVSLTTNVLTAVPLSSIVTQNATGPQWSLSGSNLIVPVSGVYWVSLEGGYTATGSANPFRTNGMQQNGTTVISGGYQAQNVASVLWTDMVHLNAGDALTFLGRSSFTTGSGNGDSCTHAEIRIACVAPDSP